MGRDYNVAIDAQRVSELIAAKGEKYESLAAAGEMLFPGAADFIRAVQIWGELQPHDVPPGLVLVPAKTVEHYDEARRAYDAVDAEHPHHADEASLQDRDDLEEAAAEGLLFDVTVNGEWAG